MVTKNLIPLIFFLQAIINGVSLSIAQKPNLSSQQTFLCSKSGDLKSDDPEGRDRSFNLLLRAIERSQGSYIGYETVTGNEVTSIALCPPNIKLEACLQCVNTTIPYLKKNCPKQKEGVAWTALERVLCMVRYANYRIQGDFTQWAYAAFVSPPNQSPYSPAELEKELNNLANKLKGMVAQDRVKCYGSGSVTFGPGSRTLYGSMQCTYGTPKDDCMKCLSDMTNKIHTCCSKQRSMSGLAATVNCYYLYRHKNYLPTTNLVTVSSTSLKT